MVWNTKEERKAVSTSEKSPTRGIQPMARITNTWAVDVAILTGKANKESKALTLIQEKKFLYFTNGRAARMAAVTTIPIRN